jgi:hypothetical protein
MNSLGNVRRFARLIAVTGALVANQVSGQYLAHQQGEDVEPPTEDLVVGKFYYL